MRRFLFTLLLLSLLYLPTASRLAAQTDSTLTLRLMTFNTHHCQGTDNVLNIARVAAIINQVQPDVVALQELDSMCTRSHKVFQLGQLAALTGMHATYGPTINYQGGKYGIGVLSKEKPLSSYQIALPGKEARTLLVCEFDNFVYAATHLALQEENRLTSATRIRQEAAKWDKPLYLAGDFNAQPRSTFMSTLKKYFKVCNKTDVGTYPSDTPTECIDYICKYRVTADVANAVVITDSMASDHRPLYVDVRERLTGIHKTKADVAQSHSAYYDLQGRRIKAPTRGLYIRDGKKVRVK